MVGRRYLESHTTILLPVGSEIVGLTIKNSETLVAKHLPRCLEPHRGKWGETDMWDYFDYEACPRAETFPCAQGQLERKSGSNETIRREKKRTTEPRRKRKFPPL
mmetsp:Transcript_8921/g.24724  ORF Transcript_8921/g.24724 Transcript_8921/m.24724 type:complete len:105 (+) Transcript_8921:682-996(+)